MTGEYQPKKIVSVRFYCEATGNEPVRKWLKTLSREDRQIIGGDIKTVEIGWPIGMPLVKNMGGGIWEVRSTLQNSIARVLFIMHKGHMILLHGFIKKTQKTTPQDLKLAQKRAKNLEN